MRWLVGAVVLSGCVMPYSLPGVRTEIGDTFSEGRGSQPRFSVGTHTASIIKPSKNPLTHIDIGVGFLAERGRDKPETVRNEGVTGFYADAGYAAVQTRRTRFFVGMRGEFRKTTTSATRTAAVKLRIDGEIYNYSSGGFSGSDHCGATAGVYSGNTGIGIYAEAGPALYSDGHEWLATTGLTFRVPTVTGVYIGVPCK